jgi:hypothetical protein
MFYLLLLLGFIAMAAGVFVGGFGIAIRETSFGAALLVVAASPSRVVSFWGLAATVRNCGRSCVQGAVAERLRPARMGGRDTDRRMGERRDVSALTVSIGDQNRGCQCRRVYAEVPVTPAKLDAPDSQERRRKSDQNGCSAPWRRSKFPRLAERRWGGQSPH